MNENNLSEHYIKIISDYMDHLNSFVGQNIDAADAAEIAFNQDDLVCAIDSLDEAEALAVIFDALLPLMGDVNLLYKMLNDILESYYNLEKYSAAYYLTSKLYGQSYKLPKMLGEACNFHVHNTFQGSLESLKSFFYYKAGGELALPPLLDEHLYAKEFPFLDKINQFFEDEYWKAKRG